MKPLLPYSSFVVETDVSAPELVKRLHLSIAPTRRSGCNVLRRKEFIGQVSETGFTLDWVTRNRNDVGFILQGRFEPSPGGTTVHVRLKLHRFLLVHFVLWSGLLTALATKAFLAFLQTQNTQFLWALGALLLFWSAMLVAFWWEADRVRQALTKLLTSPPELNANQPYAESPSGERVMSETDLASWRARDLR